MDMERIQVLLVEDDEDDYIITRDLLTGEDSHNFRVVWAKDLADGLEKLASAAFDVVLLDLSLPDSQGLDTFSAIGEANPRVPVVLLTGLSDESLGVKAVQEGAQDYLVKGDLDGHLLARAIRYAIERKKTKEQLEIYAEELSRKNRQMAEDLDLAREVQQALLPLTFPTFPAGAPASESAVGFSFQYIPSTAVGGDFFSVSALPNDRVGVFVCDVMGHGMRAALVTAIIRGLQEELRSTLGNPASFLTQLNRGFAAILSQLDQMIFASAVYLVIDIQTGQFCYASAGHPFPFLLTPTRQIAEQITADSSKNGPALGINPDYAYVSSCGELLPGDSVILFTDGLYEVEGKEHTEFGLEGVGRTLSDAVGMTPEGVLQRLVEAARQFSSRDTFTDDVCIVALKLNRLL